MSKPVITFVKNGPILVADLDNFIDSNGGRLETKPSMSLCRCGHSANKPYCDGMHKQVDFRDEVSPDRSPDTLTSYRGSSITIHNNPLLCSVAQYCHTELESVFNENNNPWIEPEGDTLEAIRALVEKCPSGALSYSINEQAQSEIDRAATISIEKNGPLRITGNIDLKEVHWGHGASREHYTLCRCGASMNKPFCDGSHQSITFDDNA